MHIVMNITGTSGLVQHNPRLADERDPYTREIKKLTEKRGKDRTEADSEQIEKLEWFGGLYHEPEVGIYIPTWNVVRALERAGATMRQGTNILRAFAVTTDKVPLIYEGAKDPEKLWESPIHRFRKMVVVDRKRVPRMRPIFLPWSLVVEGELLDEVMNFDKFVRIAELSGRVSGLGDARKLGNGRYVVDVQRS